jgi:hypothetical protein
MLPQWLNNYLYNNNQNPEPPPPSPHPPHSEQQAEKNTFALQSSVKPQSTESQASGVPASMNQTGMVEIPKEHYDIYWRCYFHMYPQLENELKQKEELIERYEAQLCRMVSQQDYDDLKCQYQKNCKENDQLKSQLKEKDNALQWSTQPHDSYHSANHQTIESDFHECYETVEQEIPRSLGLNVTRKKNYWGECSNLYQNSFDTCRKVIFNVFHQSLISITKLSEEEEKHGTVDFDRRKKLKDVTTAYQYLLKQCSSELNKVDKTSIAAKVRL